MSDNQTTRVKLDSSYFAPVLVIVDGKNGLCRAYHGTKKSGDSAALRWQQELAELRETYKPLVLLVAWDHHAPTWRHQEFPDYKGNRKPHEPALVELLNSARFIAEEIDGVSFVEREGFEADDIIGHYTTIASLMYWRVVIDTTDKDMAQLLGDHISILDRRRNEMLTALDIQRLWGVEWADQIPDLLAVVGDSSDNLPGIPGLGKKTAPPLIVAHSTLEGMIKAARDGLIKGKRGENIRDNAARAIQVKKWATIVRSVPDLPGLTTLTRDKMAAKKYGWKWKNDNEPVPRWERCDGKGYAYYVDDDPQRIVVIRRDDGWRSQEWTDLAHAMRDYSQLYTDPPSTAVSGARDGTATIQGGIQETSRAAHRQTDHGTNRERVLAHLESCGAHGSTDEEMDIATDTEQTRSLRPSRNALVKSGQVVSTGKRRVTRAGRGSIVWATMPAPPNIPMPRAQPPPPSIERQSSTIKTIAVLSNPNQPEGLITARNAYGEEIAVLTDGDNITDVVELCGVAVCLTCLRENRCARSGKSVEMEPVEPPAPPGFVPRGYAYATIMEALEALTVKRARLVWEVDLLSDVGEPDSPTDLNGYLDRRWTDILTRAEAAVRSHQLDPSAVLNLGVWVHNVHPHGLDPDKAETPRRSYEVTLGDNTPVNVSRLCDNPPPVGKWTIQPDCTPTDMLHYTHFIDGLPF